MSTDRPDGERAPRETSTLRGERVLVLASQPGDETLGCGASLADHREHGDAVTVVFLTSGDEGKVRLIREAAAGRALLELGVDAWEFWRLRPRNLHADGDLVERLHGLLEGLGPTLIYAPAPAGQDLDRRALAAALRRAVHGWGDPLSVAWYGDSVAIPVNLRFDATDAWPRKRRALSHLQPTSGPAAPEAEGFRLVRAAELGADLSWISAGPHAAAEPVPEPRVSVVVRTRDRPALLAEALDSLAGQTMSAFEVVVVNDGGGDLDSVLRHFPSLTIRLVHVSEGRGLASALNAGIAAAGAPLIAYLDDDDVLGPDHLEELAEVLERDGEFGVAYADVDVARLRRNERGDFELVSRRPEFELDFDPDLLIFENYIPNVALMHRRELWERVGGYDEELAGYEDWDFLLRLAAATGFAHVSKRTAEYRVREGLSLTTLPDWRRDALSAREVIRDRYRDRLGAEAYEGVVTRLGRRVSDAEAQAAAARLAATRLRGELIAARRQTAVQTATAAAAREDQAIAAGEPAAVRTGARWRPAKRAPTYEHAPPTPAGRILRALRDPERVSGWLKLLVRQPRVALSRVYRR